jgi:hypothetical protein
MSRKLKAIILVISCFLVISLGISSIIVYRFYNQYVYEREYSAKLDEIQGEIGELIENSSIICREYIIAYEEDRNEWESMKETYLDAAIYSETEEERKTYEDLSKSNIMLNQLFLIEREYKQQNAYLYNRNAELKSSISSKIQSLELPKEKNAEKYWKVVELKSLAFELNEYSVVDFMLMVESFEGADLKLNQYRDRVLNIMGEINSKLK